MRFLGTHDTAWLDPRQVSPWPVQLGERGSRTKAAAFVNALKEGRAYAATGGWVDAQHCHVAPAWLLCTCGVTGPLGQAAREAQQRGSGTNMWGDA